MGHDKRSLFPWTYAGIGTATDLARKIRRFLSQEINAFAARPAVVKRRLLYLAVAITVLTSIFALVVRLDQPVTEANLLTDLGKWHRTVSPDSEWLQLRSFRTIRPLVQVDYDTLVRELAATAPYAGQEAKVLRLREKYIDEADGLQPLTVLKAACFAESHGEFGLGWLLLAHTFGEEHPLTLYLAGRSMFCAAQWMRAAGWKKFRQTIRGSRWAIESARPLPEDSARAYRLRRAMVEFGRSNFCYLNSADLQQFGADARIFLPILRSLEDLDFHAALSLLERSASEGCPEACAFLGDVHDDGEVVARNPVVADRWRQGATELRPFTPAERDPAKLPLLVVPDQFRDEIIARIWFSTDESTLFAASGKHIERIQLRDKTPRPKTLCTFDSFVSFSPVSGRVLSRSGIGLDVIDVLSGKVTGSFALPPELRGNRFQAWFDDTGRRALLTAASIEREKEWRGPWSGALLDVESATILRVEYDLLPGTLETRLRRRMLESSLSVSPSLDRIVDGGSLLGPFPPDGSRIALDTLFTEYHRCPEITKGGWWRRALFLSRDRLAVLFGDYGGYTNITGWAILECSTGRVTMSPQVKLDVGFNDEQFLPASNGSSGDWIVLWDSKSMVRLFSLTTGKFAGNFTHKLRAIWSVAVSPSGRLLATCDGCAVKVWDLSHLEGYAAPVTSPAAD